MSELERPFPRSTFRGLAAPCVDGRCLEPRLRAGHLRREEIQEPCEGSQGDIRFEKLACQACAFVTGVFVLYSLPLPVTHP